MKTKRKKKETSATTVAGVFALFSIKLLMKSGTKFHKQSPTYFDQILEIVRPWLNVSMHALI